jgi:hypothetical protein
LYDIIYTDKYSFRQLCVKTHRKEGRVKDSKDSKEGKGGGQTREGTTWTGAGAGVEGEEGEEGVEVWSGARGGEERTKGWRVNQSRVTSKPLSLRT